jgi:hypothetical protein
VNIDLVRQQAASASHLIGSDGFGVAALEWA